jgi:hypothetical protein
MKIPLLYGIGVTFVLSAINLITYLLGYWTNVEKFLTGMILGLFCWFVVLTTGMILGTRRARAAQGSLRFTYGKAYLNGLMVAVFAGLTGIIFSFLFFKFLIPDFVDTQIEWTRSFMERMNVPPDKIEEAVANARAKAGLGRQLINGLLANVIAGAIISLITAAFLKRKASEDLPIGA